MAHLRSRAPESVSLVEVGTAVRFELQPPILSETELAALRNDSLKRELNRLRTRGCVRGIVHDTEFVGLMKIVEWGSCYIRMSSFLGGGFAIPLGLLPRSLLNEQLYRRFCKRRSRNPSRLFCAANLRLAMDGCGRRVRTYGEEGGPAVVFIELQSEAPPGI